MGRQYGCQGMPSLQDGCQNATISLLLTSRLYFLIVRRQKYMMDAYPTREETALVECTVV